MSTRGMMYLHPERSAVYLSKENKAGKNKPTVENAVQLARDLLRDIPEGRRRLGGFCQEPAFVKKLRKMMSLTAECRKRLKKRQTVSNVHGIIFWSLLGTTAVTGIAATLGGFLAEDGETKAALVLAFGIPMLVTALANGLIPFSRIQDKNKAIGMQLDNYMWTLRQRISVEVCTASNKVTGFHRLTKIEARLNRMCTSEKPDDGLYELPGK